MTKNTWDIVDPKQYAEVLQRGMRIYLAGPMRGIPEFNFPAFHAYAKALREQGYEVFSPAEKGMEKHAGSQYENLAFRRAVFLLDTEYICNEADAVAMMPGWEKSSGARAEKALAEAIGLKVMILEDAA
jgi:hypothetical protein